VPVKPGHPASGRVVRLAVSRIDPWSVLKLSFLLSVGIGIATVVAAVMIWSTLKGGKVFDELNKFFNEITGPEQPFDIYKWVSLGNVVSLSTVLAVINVFLITALSTLFAFLYNLASGLVGGLHVTLSDD